MKIYIGTSGWYYNWNKEKSLDWYIDNTGFNSIELNMSFYRFPYPNMVKSWAKKGKKLAWVIKVHRSITHHKKLNKGSFEIFQRFREIFRPLEKNIHYYLIQLPTGFKNINAVEDFIDEFGYEKICIEFRDKSLFNKDIMTWGEKNKLLLVSIDAPKLPRIIMSRNIVYERIHGRNEWYKYNYSKQELSEIKKRTLKNKPKIVYFFLNNDYMFENGKLLKTML